jgi:uncharacterized OB-fold protein
MENIPINWRLRKQRYRLLGAKCPTCNITLFPLKQVCPNCGYRFDICNEECEPITDDISDIEIGC